MNEPTGEKPFKTLKLTSLKSAKSKPVESGVAPEEPVASEVVAGEAAPGPIPTETPVVPEVPEGKAAAMRMPPPVVKTGGSLNMMSLKIGGTKPTASDSPGAATTPAPALSPGAASAGVGLRPFKVLSSTPSGLGVPVPPPAVISLERDVVPDTDVASKTALAAVSSVAAPVEKPPAVSKPAPVEEKKFEAPARSSRKPVFIALGVAALAVAAGVAVFVLKDAGSSAKSDVPVKRVVTEKQPEAEPVQVSGKTGAPPEMVKPAGAVVPDKVPVGAPKVRRAELDDWLQKSTVSTVTSQRITMNESHYSIGDVVNSAGNLRWMGRDSQTRDLIFIDEDGVVYTRPAGGQK